MTLLSCGLDRLRHEIVISSILNVFRFPFWQFASLVTPLLTWGVGLTATTDAQEWEAQVLPVELTVGYAVRVADINRDEKLDIVIADSKRFLWLENPTWQVHEIHRSPDARADNVCMALWDIDSDGDLDLAVGMDWQPNNTESGGAIGWLESPLDPRHPWTMHLITDNEPTVHRMNWADLNGDGRHELIVAPLKGKGSRGPAHEDRAVRLLSWTPQFSGESPRGTLGVIDESFHVMHNFQVVDFDYDHRDDLIVASYEGVHALIFDSSGAKSKSIQLGSGFQGNAPMRGSSEVRMGGLGTGHRFLVTVEPWHGNQIVVYEQGDGTPWDRIVIDDQLKWGHAVATCNLDGDSDDEIVVGVRDDASPFRSGVRIYDRGKDGQWTRQLVEPGQVAVEDLVCADLDQDGQMDIVAVGRATHNAVLYRR